MRSKPRGPRRQGSGYKSPYRFRYMFKYYDGKRKTAYRDRLRRRFGFAPAPPRYGWVR